MSANSSVSAISRMAHRPTGNATLTLPGWLGAHYAP